MKTPLCIKMEAAGFVRPLVELEASRAGSRMDAYERVGRMIGESPQFVRGLLGRYDRINKIAAHTYENIKDAYERLCERLEDKAQDLHTQADIINAALKRDDQRRARLRAAHDFENQAVTQKD